MSYFKFPAISLKMNTCSIRLTGTMNILHTHLFLCLCWYQVFINRSPRECHICTRHLVHLKLECSESRIHQEFQSTSVNYLATAVLVNALNKRVSTHFPSLAFCFMGFDAVYIMRYSVYTKVDLTGRLSKLSKDPF